MSGGAAALAPLVPGDVEWRFGDGTVLRTAELRAYWAGRPEPRVPPSVLALRDNHVVAGVDLPRPDGRARRQWLLYEFDGDRLKRALACSDERELQANLAP